MLHITSTGKNDTGNYTCEASNLLGSAAKKIQLIVEGEHKIKQWATFTQWYPGPLLVIVYILFHSVEN